MLARRSPRLARPKHANLSERALADAASQRRTAQTMRVKPSSDAKRASNPRPSKRRRVAEFEEKVLMEDDDDEKTESDSDTDTEEKALVPVSLPPPPLPINLSLFKQPCPDYTYYELDGKMVRSPLFIPGLVIQFLQVKDMAQLVRCSKRWRLLCDETIKVAFSFRVLVLHKGLFRHVWCLLLKRAPIICCVSWHVTIT